MPSRKLRAQQVAASIIGSAARMLTWQSDGTPLQLKEKTVKNYLFIGATLALTAFGQLIIKARAVVHGHAGAGFQLDYLRAMFLDALVWTGLMGAVLASICWMLALRSATLGFAYPFMALSFVIVPLAATLLFGEPFGWRNMLSIVLIVAGVALSANAS